MATETILDPTTPPTPVGPLGSADIPAANKPPVVWDDLPGGKPAPQPPVPPVQALPVEQAAQQAQDTEPDRAARVLRLSRKMPDVPPAFIENNLDDLEKAERSLGPGTATDLHQNYPVTAQYLSDPRNMAVSQDDIEALKGREKAAQESWGVGLAKNTLIPGYAFATHAAPVAKALTKGINELGANLAESPAAIYNIVHNVGQGLFEIANPDVAGKLPNPELVGLDNPVSRFFRQNADYVNLPQDQESVLQLAKDGNLDEAGKALSMKVIEGVPSLGLFLLGPGAGAALMGTTQAASAQQRAQDLGANGDKAALDSLFQGVTAGILMKSGSFAAIENVMKTLSVPAAQATAKAMLAQFAKLAGLNGSLVGGQGVLQSYANDLADYFTGVNPDALKGSNARAAESGLVGFATGVAGTGTALPHLMEGRVRQAQDSMVEQVTGQFKAGYDKFVDQVKASKLHGRDPVGDAQLTAQAVKGTPLENVHVPVEALDAYYQEKGLDPFEELFKAGAGDEYQEAKRTGGDLKVPMEKWAKLDPADLKGLGDHVRPAPDMLTPAELAQQKEMEAQVRQGIQEASQNLKGHEEEIAQAAKTPEARDFIRSVADQLAATGMRRSEAYNSAQVLHGFSVLAEKAKMPLNEFIDKYAPSIKGVSEIQKPVAGELRQEGDYLKKLNERTPTSEKLRLINDLLDNPDKAAASADFIEKLKAKIAENPVEYLNRLSKNMQENGYIGDYVDSEGQAWQIHVGDTSGILEAHNERTQSPEVQDASGVPSERSIQGPATGPEGKTGNGQDNGRSQAGKGTARPGFLQGLIQKAKDLFFPRRSSANETRAIQEPGDSPKNQKEYFQTSSQTDTPAFKKWFGDSKVVDANGKPLVVYHGTSFPNFEKFDLKTRGGLGGRAGFWFASEGMAASQFAKTRFAGEGPALYPVYLGIKNPVTYQNWSEFVEHINKLRNGSSVEVGVEKLRKQAISKGYDGIFIKESNTDGGGIRQDWVAFKPEQIKSATGNRGTFDPNDPNILHQDQGKVVKGRFYIDPSGKYFIDLAKTKDLSTFLHEAGHAYLEILQDLSKNPTATPEIKAIWQDAADYLGLKEGENLTRDQHEKWAKSFEAYLSEGKAPSKGLRNAFRHFKTWLTKLYRNAQETLGVQLDPKIRSVFDRILATEDEIAAAQHESGFTDAPLMGLPKDVNDQIVTLKKQARILAEDELTAKKVAEDSPEFQAKLARERERLVKVVGDETAQTPLYRAADGLGKDYQARAREFLKGKAEPDAQAEMETLATQHGFDNGKDLARQLVAPEASPEARQALIEQEADRRLASQKTDWRMEALKDLHTNHMTDVLALEGQILKDLLTRTGAGEVKAKLTQAKRNAAALEARLAREQAKAILSAKPHGEATDPRRYITQEKRAAVKKGQALAKKDVARAVQAQREMVYNHALAAQAMRNKVLAEKALKRLRDLGARGQDLLKAPYGFVRQIDGLLSKYGVSPKRDEQESTLMATAIDMAQKGLPADEIANETGFIQGEQGSWRQETLPEFIDRIDDDFTAIKATFPGRLMTGENRHLDNVSMADLLDLKDAANQILRLGRDYNRFKGEFSTLDIREAAGRILEHTRKSMGVEQIDPLTGAKSYKMPQGEDLLPGHATKNKYVEFMKKLAEKPAGLAVDWNLNILSLCEVMDGGHDGPMHEFFYRGLKAAESEKLRRLDEAKKAMNELLAQHFTEKELADYKDLNQGVRIAPLNRVFTKAEILAMRLNWGNEGNRNRLMNTLKMPEEAIEKEIFEHPEMRPTAKRDWDFAQGVWDHLQTYWPDIVKTEMACRGVEAQGVDPLAFANDHGRYRGGYYPIDYDPAKSADAYLNSEQKTALYKRYSSAAAHTDRGHAENRVKNVDRPLKLDPLNVLFGHLENVIHDISYRPAIIDAAKLLKRPEMKKALLEGFGLSGFRAADRWLKYIASDQRENLTDLDRILRGFRYRTTTAILGFKVANLPMDLTGNTINALHSIGFERTGSMMKDYLSNRKEIDETINALSPRMAHRDTMRDKTLSDMARRWQGKDSWIKTHALVFSNLSDACVSRPLWWKIYNEALEGGKDQRAAVDLADEEIARSVGSGSALDLSGLQMGGEMKQAVAMLGSWTNMMFNKAWIQGHISGLEYSRGNKMKAAIVAAHAAFYLWFLQAANENLWRELIRNGQDNEDERTKRIISRFVQQPFSYVWGLKDMVPIVANTGLGMAFGPGGNSFTFSPMEQSLESVIKAVGQTVNIAFDEDKHFDEAWAKAQIKAVTTLYGFPQQIDTWAFNFLDWVADNGDATWKDLISPKLKK
ncbi:MAG TPA: hypothetical protein VHE12_05775 [bacterium]|nr:hypothetical protein [bacterium]